MPEVVVLVVAVILIVWIFVGAFVVGGDGVSSLPSSSRCEDCRAFFSRWERLSLFEKILSVAYYALQKLLCIGCE